MAKLAEYEAKAIAYEVWLAEQNGTPEVSAKAASRSKMAAVERER